MKQQINPYLILFYFVSICILLSSCASDSGDSGSSGDSGEKNNSATSSRPLVLSTTPTQGDTNVSRNVVGTVTYSKPMDLKTMIANTENGTCVGSIQVSADNFTTCVAGKEILVSNGNRTFTLSPKYYLDSNTTYYARTNTNAKDIEGNSVYTDVPYQTWTTGETIDQSTASVHTFFPIDGTNNVSPSNKIIVTFKESMEPSSIQANTKTTSCETGTFLLSSDNFSTCIPAKEEITIGNNN